MMYAETHDDYDVFWERSGSVVTLAVIGHGVGLPAPPDQITLTVTYQTE